MSKVLSPVYTVLGGGELRRGRAEWKIFGHRGQVRLCGHQCLLSASQPWGERLCSATHSRHDVPPQAQSNRASQPWSERLNLWAKNKPGFPSLSQVCASVTEPLDTWRLENISKDWQMLISLNKILVKCFLYEMQHKNLFESIKMGRLMLPRLV